MSSENERQAEFRAAGMSQAGLDGFEALSRKFEAEFPSASENPTAAAQFLEDFRAETQKHVETLSPSDAAIYEEHQKKVEAGDD